MRIQINNSLPITLRMLRLQTGMSQEKFAAKIGISRGTLANYEAGKRFPGHDVLKKAAALCSVSEEIFYKKIAPYGIVLRETEEEKIKRYKQLIKGRIDADRLDLSTLSMGHKHCVVEYYDYILSQTPRKSE